jgi:hypothetical protein
VWKVSQLGREIDGAAQRWGGGPTEGEADGSRCRGSATRGGGDQRLGVA